MVGQQKLEPQQSLYPGLHVRAARGCAAGDLRLSGRLPVDRGGDRRQRGAARNGRLYMDLHLWRRSVRRGECDPRHDRPCALRPDGGDRETGRKLHPGVQVHLLRPDRLPRTVGTCVHRNGDQRVADDDGIHQAGLRCLRTETVRRRQLLSGRGRRQHGQRLLAVL